MSAKSRLAELEMLVARYREALSLVYDPDDDHYTDAFDDLCERGLLVSVRASEGFREEWGEEEMWVWEWEAKDYAQSGRGG